MQLLLTEKITLAKNLVPSFGQPTAAMKQHVFITTNGTYSEAF